MKERGKRKDSFKIVRFIALILSVLCASSSLVICASALGTPSHVQSVLTEPLCIESGLNRKYYMVMQEGDAGVYANKTILVEWAFTFSSDPSSFSFSKYGWFGGTTISSSSSFNVTLSYFDVLSGVLLWSRSYSGSFNSNTNLYNLYNTQLPVFDELTGYYFLFSVPSFNNQSEPFVTWAVVPPDQTQYKSSLPTPEWDIHNRYIVIDDKLYWISYYIDNLWINPITGSTTVSSDDHTAVVTGNASDPIDGDIYYNYNISIRYQDKDYYCLQYNSVNYSNETMCAPCLVYNSSGSRLTISFDQLSGIYSSISDILVDYRIYCSSFDLITGEYIESIFSANGQQGNAEININIDCPDEISSVYCYGVDFVNPQNLPVNLASVIWSYDLEFASWRSDIASKLDAIYSLLSQSSVPSTTAPVDYASMLNPEPTVSGYNAEDAGSLLAGAVSDVNVELGDGMDWGRNQLNDFATGVPELFLVVILALAFGLTIMILGKKKSDN